MKLCDVNPHIRFAEQVLFSGGKKFNYFVQDCRIFFILSGELNVLIENQSYSLKKGHLFFCTGGSTYYLTANNATSMLILNFDMSQSNNNITEPLSPVPATKGSFPQSIYDEIEDSSILNSHLVLQDASYFHSPISTIVDEFNKKKFYYKEKSSALLKDILTELHRKSLSATASSYGIVNDAIKYIRTNYTRDITNAEIAAHLGYHEYYLNRLFTKHTGTSIHQYILNLRLSEAKFLILNTDIPLSKIAEEVGFNNNTYFSSYFKKVYGLSPSKYRINFRSKI